MSRTAPRPRASATSRSASRRERARASPSARSALAGGDEAEAVVARRALRPRALRRLGGAPADARSTNATVTAARRRGGRAGIATTNRIDDGRARESSRARAAEAAASARAGPELPPGSRRRPSCPQVDGWDEETAALGADDAGAARRRGDRGGGRRSPSTASSRAASCELAVASTTGLCAWRSA